MDTQPLIEQQAKRKELFKAIVNQIESEDGQSRTRKKIAETFQKMKRLYDEFKETHDNILVYGKPDIPYLINGSGEKILEVMKSSIESYQKTSQFSSDTPVNMDITLGTASFDQQPNLDKTVYQGHDNENQGQPPSGENAGGVQKAAMRKLNYKVTKLVENIDSIQGELSSNLLWTKELFEVKNKFLFDQWNVIALLEEDIIMSLDHDVQIESTKVAYAKMNEVVKNMIAKLQHAKSASQIEPRRGKLPDLKIPVFNGDYKKWRNFKDIFDTMIHNRSDMPMVEKMEYLKGYLEGEPNNLIKNYLLSSENYLAAYEVLEKRYNNKRKLFTIYVDNMLKSLGKHATAEAVKELYDGISEGMTSIENMGIDNKSWGPLIVHLAINCLDQESRALFEARYNDRENEDDIPQLEDFLNFLESRYRTLEILDPMRSSSSNKIKANQVAEKKTPTSYSGNESKQSLCLKCEGDHRLFMCPNFISLSVKSRYRFVKTLNICINCLYKHKGKQCESKRTCKQCNKAHNTLLHFDKKSKDSTTNKDSTGNKASNIGHENKTGDLESEEVLATAQVIIRDVHGFPVTVRVLIDTGAQANFITEGLVQKLRLPRIPYTSEITGIGKIKSHHVKHAVETNLEPVFPSGFDEHVVALILGKELTSTTPENYISEKLPEAWPTLQLADAAFRNPGEIDMILGISFFTKILLPEIHRSEKSKLIAMKTQIGWLILGETKRKVNSYMSVRSMICTKHTVENISRFWELEDIPEAATTSNDDQYCENHFASTYKRLDDGRFVVMIPFKQSFSQVRSELQSSRNQALCRFYHLEEKFKKNHAFADQYRQFINEYIRLGHMKQVTFDKNQRDCYYLPHHAVLKPESSSTKLRVVFDASAKTKGNQSLNQLMLAGPRLQDDLSTILLRWRFHKFVVTADVEKMYRQILVAPEHSRYQRILWRDEPNEKIKEFELVTVTYGTTSAPYLAIKTLQQLALNDQHKFPVAANVALNDFYVDDVLTGADTVEKCSLLQKQLQQLLSGGGLSLRKWSSNDDKILKGINPEDINKEMLCLQDLEEKSIKTLGLVWKPKEDEFTFKISCMKFLDIKKTKRNLCSDISRIFDPLGWISPFTVGTKVLFQKTWKLSLDWDDLLPEDIVSEWSLLHQHIHELEDIHIPRWINTCQNSHVELHGFCDSSKVAYAAAIYAKVTAPNGDTTVSLLMAKTKVAPIKQELTIPRLELSGALLLSKLYSYVRKTFNWEEKRFVSWCDSTIALSWIRGEPSKWNAFVSNRVNQVQQLTKNCQWRYVPTDDNPADCASRGISINQLINHELWWRGPRWLQGEEDGWPTNLLPVSASEDLPEVKRVKASVAVPGGSSSDNIEAILQRFSSYTKAKCVIAYCLRFTENCRSNKKSTGWLSTHELVNAEKAILREVQNVYYHEEIVNIKRKQPIKNTNGILSLTPTIDDDNIIRVTGRLQNAAITYNEKHPIILPYRACISRLIVRESHLKCLHGGNSLTEYVIRRRFWIVKCKNLVKTVINQCVVCRRRRPKMGSQLMGQLPSPRVTLNNPFFYTGVDYAGPFEIKTWRGRCKKTYKAYISVFVCMTTKAVHLELASDLSAECFLAAYRRFSYRRGPCYHIYSDCGTNFIGANNMMVKDMQRYQNEWKEKTEALTINGVSWHFNPPANPHAGGLWEAAVKSVKQLLLKHIGNTLLTYEEFNTLLIQIEGCLNSRPLGFLRDVPEDRIVLTPNHFLSGTSIFTHPEPEQGKLSLSTRWRYVQHLRDQVCSDFKQQFVHQLQQRRKWNEVKENLKVGDVVIVEDHCLPQHKYPLAIINEVHSGADGLTRVVTVKMESGRLFKRPISKLCVLPVLEDDNSLDTDKVSTSQEEPNSKSAGERQRQPYNLRPRTVKASKIALTLSFLLTFFAISTAEIIPTTVQKFEHNSGLVFSKVGDMRVATSLWTMIMYYNMSSFFAELRNIEASTRMFYEKCRRSGPLATYCSATFLDIQQQLNEINEDNGILMDMNHAMSQQLSDERRKRAITSLLPFVGSLSRAAFGTLDEEYARNVERVIHDMQDDDHKMMTLIKNQTSVMETFLQQARISEERSNQQLKWISSNLEAMENSIRNQATENNLNIRLQFISSHVISRTQHLFSIQSAIIQAITNAHHGNLRGILHPGVFKKQLQLMKSSLPDDLIIPVTSENLIKLYNLLTVKTRVSENMIIFHFELPLVASRQYEVFKVIPLPIRQKDTIVVIQPSTEYISISLSREKFIPVSAAELAECSHLDENTFLCHEHHPELKNKAESLSCEVSLFVHHQFHSTICRTVAIETEQLWIQLPTPNKWIFYTKNPQGYSIMCGKKGGRHLKLEGEGMLTLHPSCSLDHSSFTIPSSNNLKTEIYSELYFPEVNLTDISNDSPVISLKNTSSVLIRRTDMFNDIQHTLNDMKHEQVLKIHQVSHHLSIGSVSVLSLFTIFALIYSIYSYFKRCSQIIPRPVPKPRSRGALSTVLAVEPLGVACCINENGNSSEQNNTSLPSNQHDIRNSANNPFNYNNQQPGNHEHPLDEIQIV